MNTLDRPRLIPGLSLRTGDRLAHRHRLLALRRADRACAWLEATDDGALVDVQILLAMDDGVEAVSARFVSDASRAAALTGQGFVRVLDAGLTPCGHPFVVREIATGETLAELLDRRRTLPIDGAVDIALALCESLGEAHAQGLVHGELAPRVVHLTWSDDAGPSDVKISDLGTARALSLLPCDARALERLANSAPELQSGQEPDGRSDVWAVGVLLYRMLAGTTPFDAGVGSTMNLAAAFEPARLLGFPELLSDVVDACLTTDPAQRPATVHALALRLAPFGFRTVAPPPSPPRALAPLLPPSPRVIEIAPPNFRPRAKMPVFIAAAIATGIAIGAVCMQLVS